ncbi:hypothetical protein Sango_0827700 [Sesamum angolense]|uniref:Transmembrane protein n=1 Tax=Sesamum angolense TaxID=2727404 RepID=A0AAE1X3T2_9LAMI|nr:hypothetical protein Sango_0827700 [Sesamum angolense]
MFLFASKIIKTRKRISNQRPHSWFVKLPAHPLLSPHVSPPRSSVRSAFKNQKYHHPLELQSSTTKNPNTESCLIPGITVGKCTAQMKSGSSRRSENQLAKVALVAIAAGVLTLGSVDPAAAAKTGGRVGGQAFRSSAPRSSGPRINNSRILDRIASHAQCIVCRLLFLKDFANYLGHLFPFQEEENDSDQCVYQPTRCPPLVGGYGYGVPFYGGWGWSPFSFFAPGPSVAIGIGGGFDLFLLFIVLGAVSAVVRKFFGSRDDYDEY